MKRNDALPEVYSAEVNKAADFLIKGCMNEALIHIKGALTLNTEAPEPHNLLGIYFEMKGDDGTARKHYRAAYALDPTYKPACRNLERLVDFVWEPVSRKYDFGIESKEPGETEQSQSTVPTSAAKVLEQHNLKEKNLCISS